jgi:hypothetical protein
MNGNFKRKPDQSSTEFVDQPKEFDPRILEQRGGTVYLPKPPDQAYTVALSIKENQMTDVVKRAKALAHLNARFPPKQQSKDTQKVESKFCSSSKRQGESFGGVPSLSHHGSPLPNFEQRFGILPKTISAIKPLSNAGSSSSTMPSSLTIQIPNNCSPNAHIDRARDPRRMSIQAGRDIRSPTKLLRSPLVNEVTSAALREVGQQKHTAPIKPQNSIDPSRDPRRRPSQASPAMPPRAVPSQIASRTTSTPTRPGDGLHDTTPADAYDNAKPRKKDTLKQTGSMRDPLFSRGRDRP